MKVEHVKIDSLVRINNEDSDNYLHYAQIKSLPSNDINGFIKVMVDETKGNHEIFTKECWIEPWCLDLINP